VEDALCCTSSSPLWRLCCSKSTRRRSSSRPWRPGPRHPLRRPSLPSLLRLLHVRVRCGEELLPPMLTDLRGGLLRARGRR
jgi:hypothetical protein